MTFIRLLMTLPLKFRSLFRRSKVESELNDELQFHIERQIEAHMKNGLRREEARYAALSAMRGVEQRKEECRDARGVSWIEHAMALLPHYARRARSRSAGDGTHVGSLESRSTHQPAIQ